MRFSTGSRLGRYEILAPLGSGGMGEVYRARDDRLGREVAIKVLPERFEGDSRRRRLVEEARAASALNHHGIVTIHEVEFEGGVAFIVMELVTGRTLASRLAEGPLPLAEALRVGRLVADAMTTAHAAGIVHRDLKPANVMLGPGRLVKVLDFGLARPGSTVEPSGAQDTVTEDSAASASPAGPLAGTAAYMSPEQAAGGAVDSRSDIFAFGSLMYEMVTGRRAFSGGSRSETLAAVLRDEPARPGELVPAIPRDLERVILRCLRKEPARRFQHMADLKVELEEIGDVPSNLAAMRAGRRRALAVLGASLALLIAAGAYWLLRRAAPLPPSRVVELTAMQGSEGWPTLSPDGTQVAFSWEGDAPTDGRRTNRDIWLKMIGAAEIRRLTSDPGFDAYPSWSPDGRSIAFLRGWSEGGALGPEGSEPYARIWLASPIGGVERKVSDFRADASPLSWSPDGRFLAARGYRAAGDDHPEAGAIHLITVQDGQARAITAPPPPAYHTDPAFSPDGRRLAFGTCAARYNAAPCEVDTLDLGPDFRPSGAPRRVASEGARAGLTGSIGGIAWTRDGTFLVYTASLYGQNDARLLRVSAEGGLPAERVEIAGRGAQHPAAAGGQDRLAFTLRRSADDIYRFEPGRPPTAVVASTFQDAGPSFSPDGRRIVFESGRSGRGEIWVADADGSSAVQLTHGPGVAQVSPSFSPDGRRVAFTSIPDGGFADVWVIDVAGGGLRRLTEGPFHEGLPSWSRDGGFIYYGEARADGHDIYRVAAAGGTPQRITHHGGHHPSESPDGDVLFYARRYGTAGTSPLMSLGLPDGPERQVVDCIFAWSLATGPDGIYYTGCPEEAGELPFYRLETRSGRRHRLGSVPARGFGAVFLGVSPDAKTILFTKQMAPEADLMLIEHFR